jgi:hypothetical protein
MLLSDNQMNINKIKKIIKEYYLLANTPSYLYRRIEEIALNTNIDDLTEDEINDIESKIKTNEPYLYYFTLYLKVKNNYYFDNKKYNFLKWINEYLAILNETQINNCIITINSTNIFESDNTFTEVTLP